MLNTINTELNNIGIPYEYMRWTKPVTDRFWVGEYLNTPTDTEDGYMEYTMILTGTTKGSWYDLELDRKKIENHFPTVSGLRKSTDEGTVVIFYDYGSPIPTQDMDVKRMQINLQIKIWKGLN